MSLTGKGLRYWLPYFLINTLLPKEKPIPGVPIHIFLCIVDHFEPFNGPVDFSTALKRVKVWREKYPIFADKHKDSVGKPLQHSWFYPPHLNHSLLPYLIELCIKGYGDIEMHLHHNLMNPFPDTSHTLKTKILHCIEDYGKYGIFIQPKGKPRFGFIHGDWSLDNSGGNHLCGVNDELNILVECGCYADFTFPCLNKSQPALLNSIYYAIDNPNKRKSYNRGAIACRGIKNLNNSLLMIPGILGLRYDERKKFKFSIEYSDLDINDPPTERRVDFWIKNAITVKGMPNWKFIKLHTHSGPESRWDANFGMSADIAFGYLEKNYNDGKNYILHYVTPRQIFNLIKSIEYNNISILNDAMEFEVKRYCYKI